jgi:hypothetical protein
MNAVSRSVKVGVQEIGPGLGSISLDGNRTKSRRMKREQDGVKQNNEGIIFNLAN